MREPRSHESFPRVRPAWLPIAASAFALLGLVPVASAQPPSPLAAPNLELYARGIVHAVARTADGGIVVGGQFSSVYDPATQLSFQRDNLARFSADGALDLAWDPAASGPVYALAVHPDGSIFVGGEFDFVDEKLHPALVKLSGTGDGAVDDGWNAPLDGFVLSLALDAAGGKLYAGGQFATTSAPPVTNVARFAIADGSLEPSWAPNANGRVLTLLLEGAALYVGGDFNQIGGRARNRLAKLSTSGTGAADEAWNPAPNLGLQALAPVPGGGSIYVGGGFSTIGGQARNALARLSTTGSGEADPAWNPGLVFGTSINALAVDAAGNVVAGGFFVDDDFQPLSTIARFQGGNPGAIDPSFDPAVDAVVLALAARPDGGMLVGGEFKRVDNQVALGFARLSSTGSLESTPYIQSLGKVQAIVRAPDGGAYLGGDFARANGYARGNLLRLTAAGTIDDAWDPDTNDEVLALARTPEGSIYAGGTFTLVGGLPRGRLAKLSGSGAGAVDPDWIADAQGGGVAALAVGFDGALYVGGAFSNMAFVPRSRLAKVALGGTGELDPDWNPGANEYVRALLLDAGGTLYAGGRFTQVGAQPHVGLARMSTLGIGVVDAAWVPSANQDVVALAQDQPGSIVAGGFFSQVNGTPRDGIARLSTSGDGALDGTWIPPDLGLVWTLATATDGAVYAGGTGSLVRLSDNGAIDPAFQLSSDGTVLALALDPAGTLYAGGQFSSIGAQFRRLIAALPTRPEAIFGDGFE